MREVVDLHQGIEKKYIECLKALDAKEKQVMGLEQEKKDVISALNEASDEFQKVEEELTVQCAEIVTLTEVLAQRDKELIELKATLDVVPTAEMVINEFKTSTTITDLIKAKIEKYRYSDKFKKDMQSAHA